MSPSLTVQCGVQAWLCAQGVEAAVAGRVLRIIAGVGFKEELASGGPGALAVSLETAVVQDADRWAAPPSPYPSLRA